jgi:hypothetical protein
MSPTSRTKPILGLIGAAAITLSSGAHGMLGWPGIGEQLTRAAVPPDLARALMVGWLYGSMAMATFGIVAAWLFTSRLRGRFVPAFPTMAIGIAYVLFGAWATTVTREAFFPLVFMLPGSLLVLASRTG